ncbi:MAG: SprT family zinc-dependent metalloprotease [Deltaproteobacteria bacterium]|nr:SprT family zinc-dependent metalloprotease [Deltaproteobacteria bacterium]
MVEPSSAVPHLPVNNAARLHTLSDPFLQQIWDNLIDNYFPEQKQLTSYTVAWSKRRQKRTLASCSVSRRRISVARELNHPACQALLEPLLYHELCHAYLAQFKYLRHGKRFQTLEALHPKMRELQDWIQTGGWAKAVRSDRARRAHARRKGYTS